jgi:hypothetical protein
MSYPEKDANYRHNPKFIDRMKHAEGGAATNVPLPPAKPFDLRSQDGLQAARQKLDNIGLGRAITVGPSTQDKD